MPISQEEKDLMQLLARYTAITTYKDNGIIDLEVYSKLLWDNLNTEEMKRIKYYMEHLNGHHAEKSEFMDDVVKKK